MKRMLSEGLWARWGLLVSALLLGAALVVATWSNYKNAQSATAALHEGQARVLEREIMGALRRAPDTNEFADTGGLLDSLLAAQNDAGLRYLAVFDAAGSLAAKAGTALLPLSAAPAAAADGPWLTLTTTGSRVRASMFRRARNGPLPPHGEPASPHRPSGVVFEFEPLVASRLVEQARGLLAFGFAAAIAMTLVSGLSWGMSRRYERAKRSLEQERRLSLLGQMSAVLAHEIRNPLASLKGHAQLLAEHLAADSADRRKADRVVLEASRLEALTGDLLDFVRTGPLDRRTVEPGALLRACAEEVDLAAFSLDFHHAPGSWVLDGPRMRQVFVNVLRNAVQTTNAANGKTEASMRVEDHDLVITVRDHGEGLPRGQEDRIFDPFFTTRTTGTGLGLAVARRIVELHGGSLGASNHPEGGAVFRIVLPEGRG